MPGSVLSPSSPVLTSPGEHVHHPKINQEKSFFWKRYQSLRVAGSVLSSAVASLFYKTISCASWIFQLKSASQRYGALAHYHWRKAESKGDTYKKYGDKMMNFAMNTAGLAKAKEMRQEKGSKMDQLKAIYGDGFEKICSDASIDEIPIEKKRLSPLSITDGIEEGATLDFIRRFLELYGKNQKWFLNIDKISQLFVNGGTPEAQIAQILMQGQKLDKLQANLEKNVARELQYKALASRLHNINFESSIDIRIDCNPTKRKEGTVFIQVSLRKNLENLAPGAYLVNLRNATQRYTIAYIKEPDVERGFIFDPKRGTILLEGPGKQVNELTQLMKDFDDGVTEEMVAHFHKATRIEGITER